MSAPRNKRFAGQRTQKQRKTSRRRLQGLQKQAYENRI